MESSLTFAFALEYVADVAAAKRFYVDVLGFEVERESPAFVQLRDRSGVGFALAGDEPVGGERALIELYWATDDADAAFAALSRAADVRLPLTQFPFGRVFAIADPDGHPRYVVEFARSRPSQPVL